MFRSWGNGRVGFVLDWRLAQRGGSQPSGRVSRRGRGVWSMRDGGFFFGVRSLTMRFAGEMKVCHSGLVAIR